MAPKQRDRVLALLRDATEAVDAHQLALQLDLHVTTVRFHLNGLAEQGLVRQQALTSQRVGRPRTGYVAVREPSYTDLVALLAAHLGGTAADREQRAEQVGRDWAGTITVTAVAGDACDLVIDVLARLGFQTQSATSMFDSHTLTLCTCPLAETARRNPEVVRGIQRGLIQGVLDSAAGQLGTRFVVDVVPDPEGGNCRIGMVLNPATRPVPVPAAP